MRNLKNTLVIILLLSTSCFLLLSTIAVKPQKLRHVVAFKFKPEISPEQMQKAAKDFLALKSKVPQIIEIEGGPDLSFQKKNGKFTHCFMVTVKDEKELAAYGVHPDHKAFSQSVDPLLAEVMIVDYWVD